MALSQADYLKANLDPKLLALKQAKEKALQSLGQERQGYENDYTSGIDATNQERDKTLPTFQVQRNQADATTAQRVQDLRNTMASRGLYRSGTTVSDEVGLQNQGASMMHDIDTQQNNFLGGIASKIAELNRVKAQRLGDVDQRMNLANTQYAEQEAGERNKALADYNAYQEQAAQSRLSAARKSSAPSISSLNRQDKLNAQDATAGALDALYRDAPNMTRAELNRAVQQMRGQWYRDGVDMKEIQQALDGVQTADEIQAEQQAAYKQKLASRPVYQKLIDAILPGSQWG